jgi:hypothetical protein
MAMNKVTLVLLMLLHTLSPRFLLTKISALSIQREQLTLFILKFSHTKHQIVLQA